jgi:hypothetical protein
MIHKSRQFFPHSFLYLSSNLRLSFAQARHIPISKRICPVTNLETIKENLNA